MNGPPIMANAVTSTEETTILLVEDEVMVRAVLSDGLRDEGFRVVEATNADEAVSILSSTIKVDLVITDMKMPGAMDGSALVDLIRAEYPFLRVVMVAGQSPGQVTLQRLHGFLLKPVTPSKLSRYLREFILPRTGHRDVA